MSPKEYWRWGQHSPEAQKAVICNSMEGWASNLADGYSRLFEAEANILRNLAELHDLQAYLDGTMKW